MTNHRARSVIAARRDPSMDQIDTVVKTMEGKNNPVARTMPAIDAQQAMKALIADAAGEPCYLCGDEPYAVQHWKVPEGLNLKGQEQILYTLCLACTMDLASKGKVEYKLVRQMQEENGTLPIEVLQ
jgi:hypothetical protein